MQTNKEILVVAAHPDDELLGVGGTILRHVAKGDRVQMLILADGETSRISGVDVNKRSKQAHKVADLVGAEKLILKQLPDNQMDTVSLLDIARIVEETVDEGKPDTIYTHAPYDLNVDHRLTCQAVLTAARPQPGHCVREILCFETLSSTEWQIKNASSLFCPTVYHDISKFIDKKVELLQIYKDEMRDWPHPRSIEGVKILGQYRGMEVGYQYAEAFQLIRKLN